MTNFHSYLTYFYGLSSFTVGIFSHSLFSRSTTEQQLRRRSLNFPNPDMSNYGKFNQIWIGVERLISCALTDFAPEYLRRFMYLKSFPIRLSRERKKNIISGRIFRNRLLISESIPGSKSCVRCLRMFQELHLQAFCIIIRPKHEHTIFH